MSGEIRDVPAPRGRVHVGNATGVSNGDYVAYVGWIYRTEFTFSWKRFSVGVFANFRTPGYHTLFSIAVGPFAFKWTRWRPYS